jgi:hypothetical protein
LIRALHGIFWIVDRWIKQEIKIQEIGQQTNSSIFFHQLTWTLFKKKKKKNLEHMLQADKSKYPGQRMPGKLQMEASEIQQKRCAAMFSSSRELLDQFPSL